jgi:MFS family permease
MRLWTSETIGAFGRQVTGLALPTVAILSLKAGPTEMGILNGLGFIAFPILGLIVGVWADRWRRRPIMIVANVGRMIALGSIPIAFILGLLNLYQMYVVAGVVGVFTVFFDVSYQSYLPSLIERDDLVEGNSKLETSQSAAQVAGPSIAGVLIQLVGAAQAVAVDALAFLTSAFFIFSIRKKEVKAEASGQDPDFIRELKEGARVVTGSPILRRIAACTATFNFGSQFFYTVFLLYVYNELQISPGIVGLVFSVGAVGVLLGAILAARIAKMVGIGPVIALSTFVGGLGLFAILLVPNGPAVPILIAMQLVTGFTVPLYNINQVSLRQAITPDRLQGRMNATIRTIVWGTIPLGAFIGGLLGAEIGIFSTMLTGAVLTTLSVIPVAFGPVFSLREIPKQAT